VLRGDKGGYELRIPTGEWSKVAPGTLNPESQADLELVRSGYSAWLSVKRTSGSAMRIEQFVYGRRSQFLAGGATHYRERRFFLANDHLVPASLARYRNGSQIFLILTALKGQLAIEVLGLVQRGRGVETELLEILESVRFLEEESPL
jgi:hypothetical protein